MGRRPKRRVPQLQVTPSRSLSAGPFRPHQGKSPTLSRSKVRLGRRHRAICCARKQEQMTITGYQKRILEAAPAIGKNKAERLAIKLVKRQERMLEQFDFDESLRIFGVITDTTPRDAIRNIEREAAA